MTGLTQLNEQQQARIAACKITQADIDRLERHGPELEAMLPDILAGNVRTLETWPELRQTIPLPEMGAVRLAHWTRLVKGQVGPSYYESANEVATTFLRHGLSSFSVSVCQSTVLREFLDRIDGRIGGRPRVRNPFRRQAARAEARALQDGLNKLAWLDLGLLLRL